MSFESNTTKQAKNEIKKETNMKTPKKTIIYTILLTIAAITLIVGLLFAGWLIRGSYEAGIDHVVNTKLTSLTAVVEAKK